MILVVARSHCGEFPLQLSEPRRVRVRARNHRPLTACAGSQLGLQELQPILRGFQGLRIDVQIPLPRLEQPEVRFQAVRKLVKVLRPVVRDLSFLLFELFARAVGELLDRIRRFSRPARAIIRIRGDVQVREAVHDIRRSLRVAVAKLQGKHRQTIAGVAFDRDVDAPLNALNQALGFELVTFLSFSKIRFDELRHVLTTENLGLHRSDSLGGVVADRVPDEVLWDLRRCDEDLRCGLVRPRQNLKSREGAGKPQAQPGDDGPPRAHEPVDQLERYRQPAGFAHGTLTPTLPFRGDSVALGLRGHPWSLLFWYRVRGWFTAGEILGQAEDSNRAERYSTSLQKHN